MLSNLEDMEISGIQGKLVRERRCLNKSINDLNEFSKY